MLSNVYNKLLSNLLSYFGPDAISLSSLERYVENVGKHFPILKDLLRDFQVNPTGPIDIKDRAKQLVAKYQEDAATLRQCIDRCEHVTIVKKYAEIGKSFTIFVYRDDMTSLYSADIIENRLFSRSIDITFREWSCLKGRHNPISLLQTANEVLDDYVARLRTDTK